MCNSKPHSDVHDPLSEGSYSQRCQYEVWTAEPLHYVPIPGRLEMVAAKIRLTVMIVVKSNETSGLRTGVFAPVPCCVSQVRKHARTLKSCPVIAVRSHFRNAIVVEGEPIEFDGLLGFPDVPGMVMNGMHSYNKVTPINATATSNQSALPKQG